MANPFKSQADSSKKSKAAAMGKTGNLDLKVMKGAGENNSKKLYSSSTRSAQHQNQSAADGMKRGGHVGKPKHHKPKIAMVATAPDPALPPSPDPAMAAAGAGPSPSPAPMPPGAGAPPPGQPPMKRGGKVGSLPTRGGGNSGVGRLEKTKGGEKTVKGKLSPIMG